ncbi:hypothetical protein Efla_001876 [Eimeria flavescens]
MTGERTPVEKECSHGALSGCTADELSSHRRGSADNNPSVMQSRGSPRIGRGCTRRRRSCGGSQQSAAFSGQPPRSSLREAAPPRGSHRGTDPRLSTLLDPDLPRSRSAANVEEQLGKSGTVPDGLQTDFIPYDAPEDLNTTQSPYPARHLQRGEEFCAKDPSGERVPFSTVTCTTTADADAPLIVGSPKARARTAHPTGRGGAASLTRHEGDASGLSPGHEGQQPRSSSVSAAVSLSEAAAAVAKKASSAFVLPPLGTTLPPELLSDIQQHVAASSAAGHATTELAEQLEVLKLAATSRNFTPNLHLTATDTAEHQKRTASLSTSNRRAAAESGDPCSSETTRSRRLQETTRESEVHSRKWRSSADTFGGLRHRPLLHHETSHSRGGVSSTRQRVFLSDSMGRNAEKERRWAGGRVARPLWHDVPTEETPRKLNLTSFVGDTWTSRLKGKLIIVVRRLPFDIRTTSNCLAKLESLLLGQPDSLQSSSSPSPLSSFRIDGSKSEGTDLKGLVSGSGSSSQPQDFRKPVRSTSALTAKNFQCSEESLITPSRSAEEMGRVSTGGPAARWGSTTEADVDADSGRRDAFRLRSLALARELLRRVRSEMQLVPQRGKAIRSLLEAPFGPPSAAKSDGGLLPHTEAVPTNPADYTSAAGDSAQRGDSPSEQASLPQQEESCNSARRRTADRTDAESLPRRTASPSLTSRSRSYVGEPSPGSREKSTSQEQTIHGGGNAVPGGTATDGLVVLSGADIAWDIATTLKPYVPCITISDLGIDWEEMGLTGSEQQLMQQRVLDTFSYLCHVISGTGFSHLDWQGYVRMNEEFAKAVEQDYAEGDVVLIYDYHFMLLPLMLRHAIPKATVVVHWATVFPSSEMFRILPQREPLLSGLLGADLITFQAYAFHRQFANTCRMLRGPGSLAGVRLAIVPRGLDPTPWLQQMRLQKSGGPSDWEELREKLGGRTVFVSVDSISANSGIPHKMVAFRHFLQEHPEYINKVVFVQAAITDSTAPDTFLDQDPRQLLSETECHELLSQVYHFVGCINSEFGAVASQAVHFLTVPWTAEGLSPLFACADVCLATSVRESFSWAAYAFILCQKFSNKGVLVLSEFSGSAQALGAGALMVNPWNARSFAAALLDALNMSEQERAERHAYAYRYCTKHSDKMWARQLLTELGTVLRTPSKEANTPGDPIHPGLKASSASSAL